MIELQCTSLQPVIVGPVAQTNEILLIQILRLGPYGHFRLNREVIPVKYRHTTHRRDLAAASDMPNGERPHARRVKKSEPAFAMHVLKRINKELIENATIGFNESALIL